MNSVELQVLLSRYPSGYTRVHSGLYQKIPLKLHRLLYNNSITATLLSSAIHKSPIVCKAFVQVALLLPTSCVVNHLAGFPLFPPLIMTPSDSDLSHSPVYPHRPCPTVLEVKLPTTPSLFVALASLMFTGDMSTSDPWSSILFPPRLSWSFFPASPPPLHPSFSVLPSSPCDDASVTMPLL